MKRLRFLLFAVAGVPLLASAQAARVDAASPQAGASATLPYQSAFAGYLLAPQSDVTPDKAWLQANSELAAAGGHVGHGMMSMHQDKAPAAGQAFPQQAQQAHHGHAAAQATSAAAAAAPHQGHQAAPSQAPQSAKLHEGHQAGPSPAPPSANPQRGHQAEPPSARPSSDPHQGHAAPQPASPAADPHQGHHMQMKGQ